MMKHLISFKEVSRQTQKLLKETEIIFNLIENTSVEKRKTQNYTMVSKKTNY